METHPYGEAKQCGPGTSSPNNCAACYERADSWQTKNWEREREKKALHICSLKASSFRYHSVQIKADGGAIASSLLHGDNRKKEPKKYWERSSDLHWDHQLHQRTDLIVMNVNADGGWN